MKKGIWTIFLSILLIALQVFGTTGVYLESMQVYSVCYSIFGLVWEIVTDSAILFYLLNYIVGVLGLALLLWGIRVYAKDTLSANEQNRFVDSYYAIKDTRTLAQCAVLVALYVVLDMLPKFPYLEITFAFVALAGIAYIAGPVSGFFCGGICEVLGYLLAPKTGPLHLGFTLTAMLTGFVMGCFLYKKDLNLWRIIISRSIVAVFLNLGLNTYWLSNIYGDAFLVLIPSRAVKLLQLPLDVFLIFAMIKVISMVNKKTNK